MSKKALTLVSMILVLMTVLSACGGGVPLIHATTVCSTDWVICALAVSSAGSPAMLATGCAALNPGRTQAPAMSVTAKPSISVMVSVEGRRFMLPP